jgi:L-fuconolactonase
VEIVDAQIHNPDLAFAWDEERTRLDVTCEVMLAAMDAVGVDAAILAPRHERFFAEVAVARAPQRFARVVMLDHSDPAIDERVAEAKGSPGVVALRHVIADYVGQRGTEDLRAGVFEALFSAAERAGIPLFLLGPGFPGDVAGIARAHPELTLIVDHFGLRQYPPLSMDPDPFEKWPDLVGLAGFPNVAVKFCGAQLLSAEPYPHRDVWPRLHEVLDAFGVDRLMWASDFTRLRMVPDGEPWRGTYAESLGFVRDSGELSDDELAALLGGTARRLLSWPRAG